MILREGLGYARLTPQEQQVYQIILKTFSSLSAVIDVPQIGRGVDLMKAVQVALGDNPSVTYFDKTQLKKVNAMSGQRIQLMGVPFKSQILKRNAELDAKSNAIAASVRNLSTDEFVQLIKLYEYLQSHVRYDHQELVASAGGRARNPDSHNAYGALLKGLAVCDGFSTAFSLLTQKLGFSCMLVSGRSAHRLSASVDHAWNIVRIRNKCYHMDVTWDTNQFYDFGAFTYDYFALDDEEISNDHDWNINTTPACSSNDYSYFLKNGLFANNADQLSDIVRAAVKNRNETVRLKLSYNIVLPANAGEYLAQMVLDEAVQSGKSAQISFFWNEHTRCFYAKLGTVLK